MNFELAVGAGLRAAGLSMAYEQSWDGLTPDWTALSDTRLGGSSHGSAARDDLRPATLRAHRSP